LERAKGIEPSYAAWKSTNFISIFNDRSDKSALTAPVEPKQLFWFVRTGRRARVASVCAAHAGKIDPTAAANRVIIMLKPGRQAGQSSASLPDGTVLVQASRQPFLEAARFLLNLGYPPETWIEGWRSGATEFALRARLGTAAGLSVDETKTVLAKWKPFPLSAVTSPVRSGGDGSSSAKPEATISSETVDDPDSPDQRQRPRTGNASAGT
jgi:hypothetical protein